MLFLLYPPYEVLSFKPLMDSFGYLYFLDTPLIKAFFISHLHEWKFLPTCLLLSTLSPVQSLKNMHPSLWLNPTACRMKFKLFSRTYKAFHNMVKQAASSPGSGFFTMLPNKSFTPDPLPSPNNFCLLLVCFVYAVYSVWNILSLFPLLCLENSSSFRAHPRSHLLKTPSLPTVPTQCGLLPALCFHCTLYLPWVCATPIASVIIIFFNSQSSMKLQVIWLFIIEHSVCHIEDSLNYEPNE